MKRDPAWLAQEQLDAYNAHDLERFVAVYAEDVRAYRMPSTEPFLSGKTQFAEHYAANRFNNAALRAELVNRIAFGNKVIDHERIFGIGPRPVEAAAVYEIHDNLIQTVWFFNVD